MQRCCPETAVYDRDLTGEAALFKALADPVRVAILATLARAEHEVCVCDFTSGVELNQSTVSHHLRFSRTLASLLRSAAARGVTIPSRGAPAIDSMPHLRPCCP